MSATTTTSIKLDATLKERLQQLAVARRRSVHWLMREAIAEFLEREEQRALSAFSDFEGHAQARTDEAYAWLAKLEAKSAGTSKPARPSKPGKWRE